MYTSSKVTQNKYAVATSHISAQSRKTVVHENVLRPLLTMYFFALSFRKFELGITSDVKSG